MYTITDQERTSGHLTEDKLANILSDISEQGYAVVSDLVSSESRQLLMSITGKLRHNSKQFDKKMNFESLSLNCC